LYLEKALEQSEGIRNEKINPMILKIIVRGRKKI